MDRPHTLSSAHFLAEARARNPVYNAPPRLSDLPPDERRVAMLDRDRARRDIYLASYADRSPSAGRYLWARHLSRWFGWAALVAAALLVTSMLIRTISAGSLRADAAASAVRPTPASIPTPAAVEASRRPTQLIRHD